MSPVAAATEFLISASAMGKLGRPPAPYPRRHAVFIRFSAAEWGALEQALRYEHPVATRRPGLGSWLRDLAVAHATEVLQVEVTRSGLRALDGGAPDWKRWRLSRAVRRAAAQRRGRAGANRAARPSRRRGGEEA